MKVFTVNENGCKTICNTFEEATKLMLKINAKGGNSYLTSFNHDFDSEGGNINTSRPTLSPEQRRYERTGRL